MVEATESIQEVIVTGYNSIQKESFTGNTTKIEKEDLLKVNPNNLISAIQTFDPSFRIQENLAAGSDPNSLPSIRLAWSDRYWRNDTRADLHLLHFAGSAKR